MAAPEFENLPSWMQGVIGLTMGTGMLGAMAVRFFGGRTAPEAGKHVVVEQAELADLDVLRSVARKLDDALRLAEAVHDLRIGQEAVADRQRAILDILTRIDRKDEMRAEMRAVIREQRQSFDDKGDARR